MSSSTAAAPNAPGLDVGQTLEEAVLSGLNGPDRRLSSYRGRPLIINVWASWCGPCRQEMASLERLAWRSDPREFAIIGVSTDDYPDQAKAFLSRSNATISHFIDKKLAIETMLGASRLPLTVLIDGNGKVMEKVYGSKEWDGPEARKLLASAFGSQPNRRKQ